MIFTYEIPGFIYLIIIVFISMKVKSSTNQLKEKSCESIYFINLRSKISSSYIKNKHKPYILKFKW